MTQGTVSGTERRSVRDLAKSMSDIYLTTFISKDQHSINYVSGWENKRRP